MPRPPANCSTSYSNGEPVSQSATPLNIRLRSSQPKGSTCLLSADEQTSFSSSPPVSKQAKQATSHWIKQTITILNTQRQHEGFSRVMVTSFRLQWPHCSPAWIWLDVTRASDEAWRKQLMQSAKASVTSAICLICRCPINPRFYPII